MFEDSNILTLDVLDDPPGLEIIDQFERLRYQLWTTEPVAPVAVDPDKFHFPVSSAFEITAETVSFPTTVSICLRDEEGGMIADVGHMEEESVGDGQYIIELGAQIKTYVEVEGPIEITSDLLEKTIDFGQQRRVRVGIRSLHKQPATTVTTTEEPRDMMAAISTFGSALKSTSPERSYPTLRGHPPNIEVGEALNIPATIESPDTGVRIQVPETYEAIYTVAPLAYYLGARVEPGTTPRLVTNDGFEYQLDSPNGLETGAAQVLKQLFTLDCVTRVDGLYNINLHERNIIEERIDIDFESVYDKPLTEQVATYLSIPYSKLQDCIPKWRLTTHVEPVQSTVELLPFVVNDLSTIQITNKTHTEKSPASIPASQSLARSGAFTRSATREYTRSTVEQKERETEQYVELEPADSQEQAWVGDGIPIGASKLTKSGFENLFNREKMDGSISITIVVNDTRMTEEKDLVNQVYGDREDLPFDINIHSDLTVEEFERILAEEHSFLHYIGHVEERGFRCSDGIYDASALESTDIDSFMLNACDSYRQGLHLVDAGAVGGIVTLNDIINNKAVEIGESLAHLLNSGFPLDTSLSIAREENVLGGQYIIVGTGGVSVTQQPGRVPFLIDVVECDDRITFDIATYASNKAGLGTIFKPHVSGVTEFYVSSGIIQRYTLPPRKFDEFLELRNAPVRLNGELHWGLSVDEIYSQ